MEATRTKEPVMQVSMCVYVCVCACTHKCLDENPFCRRRIVHAEGEERWGTENLLPNPAMATAPLPHPTGLAKHLARLSEKDKF